MTTPEDGRKNVVIVETARRPHWGRWVLYAAVGLFTLWLVWAGRAIWFPVAIAFVIAMVLDPTVDRLENRGISRALATTLVFLIFVCGTVLAVLVLSPIISQQAGAMAQDLGRLFPDPQHPSLVPVTQKILAKLDTNPVLKQALLNAAHKGTYHLQRTFSRGSELALAWAPNLIWLLVVPVLAFYTLIDFHRIYAKAVLLVPPRHRETAQSVIVEISALFGKYLRGLALICVLLAACIAGILFAFHNPYWQLLGVLGGLLYAVPVVGPICTLGLVMLITLVTATPGKALAVGGCLLILQSGLFDQVITPRIVGRQVGLHPILTILALLLGYQIAGVVGMLVAVPLAASAQTIILHLVPKLRADLELKPLEELKRVEDEALCQHLEAEERMHDEHFRLQTVVENVEPADAASDEDEDRWAA